MSDSPKNFGYAAPAQAAAPSGSLGNPWYKNLGALVIDNVISMWGGSPKSPEPGPGVSGHPELQTFHGVLREIRVCAQKLQQSLTSALEKSELVDPQVRTKELAADLHDGAALLAQCRGDVQRGLNEIQGIYSQRSDIRDQFSDEVKRIEIDWNEACRQWPTGKEAADEIARKAKKAASALKELVFHCGYITVPPRLNQHLLVMRSGQAVDFHDIFRDELPDLEERSHILRHIAAHPRAVEGIVDAEAGVVYSASRSLARRCAGAAIIGAVLLAGPFVLFGLTKLGQRFSPFDWPLKLDNFQDYIWIYFIALLGSASNLAVEALKQSRRNDKHPFLALDDIVLWIHIKEIPILVGILSIYLVPLGFHYFNTGLADWKMAFVAGYGIDNFLELILQRFDRAVSQRTAKVKALLEPT